jgi:hypothetical protein
MLVIRLTLALSSAAGAVPVGGCPKNFTLMEVMQLDDMEHTHAGLKADLNGDGDLCMRTALVITVFTKSLAFSGVWGFCCGFAAAETPK